jgi:threonine/homoserine/homoserine lactone efflux protein
MLTELVAFVPVAAVVICSPGPDTALDLTSLLRASAPAFLALKAASAVYLVCLGVRLAAEQR